MSISQFAMDERGSPRRTWFQTTTQVLAAADPGAIPAAAAAVQRGELIIVPTDTVYGVGSNAFDELAVLRLFAAKQRERAKGIPILIADAADLMKIAAEVPPTAEQLIARFWPGPLTIVLPKRPDLPPAISQTATIAVRMPDHKLCREIIRAAGGALAATSANLSGRKPALVVREALHDLAGVASVAIDDGPSAGQVASTVVDVTGDLPRILRAGPLAIADLLQEAPG